MKSRKTFVLIKEIVFLYRLYAPLDPRYLEVSDEGAVDEMSDLSRNHARPV